MSVRIQKSPSVVDLLLHYKFGPDVLFGTSELLVTHIVRPSRRPFRRRRPSSVSPSRRVPSSPSPSQPNCKIANPNISELPLAKHCPLKLQRHP